MIGSQKDDAYSIIIEDNEANVGDDDSKTKSSSLSPISLSPKERSNYTVEVAFYH